MFLLRAPRVHRLLERFGVLCRWRATMTLDLRRLQERAALPAGYEIVGWDPARLIEVARLDYLAYRGTLDGRLYWEYFSTPQGCERMWREAVAGKFGTFDPDRTLLLERNGLLCGDVMCSIKSPGFRDAGREAFIGNLAVLPEHRGGTGTALLLTSLWRCREAGFDRASLAVTLENQPALRLYTRLGFVISGEFPLVTRPAVPA